MGNVKKNVITEVPKLGRWMEYDGFSMPYSFPAMIALAECWLRSLEDGTPLSYTTTYQIYKKLLHFTGMAYGFLWNDGDEMIGELWRINHFDDMVQRAMAGLGRDYIWMNIKDCSCEKMKQKIVQTIDNKMPVVMEFAGMLPEFNLVAGYDDYGDTLIGWTYCEELVEEREDNEMFRKFAEWSNPTSKEYNKYKALILGERVPVTLTDHQAIEYALETMERTESQDHGYMSFLAGRSAFEKSVAYLTSEKRDGSQPLFDFYVDINTIQTKKCVLPYYVLLVDKYPDCKDLRSIVDILRSGFERMEAARNQLFSEEQIGRETQIKCADSLLEGQQMWTDCLKQLVRLQGLDKPVSL